jgi:hypothetical protein
MRAKQSLGQHELNFQTTAGFTKLEHQRSDRSTRLQAKNILKDLCSHQEN